MVSSGMDTARVGHAAARTGVTKSTHRRHPPVIGFRYNGAGRSTATDRPDRQPRGMTVMTLRTFTYSTIASLVLATSAYAQALDPKLPDYKPVSGVSGNIK